jgi:CDGSH-type Zn-finger protein
MSEKVTAQVRENGSVRITGSVDFVDAEGNVLETKENFSLCRCGHSANKPFCDGAHKAAAFIAPTYAGPVTA